MHTLLEIDSADSLGGHPKIGVSWEGYIIEQLLGMVDTHTATYWATHTGAELDLMITVDGRRYGFECKYADAPAATRSMRVALADLKLEHLWVLYPGDQPYSLEKKISVLPIQKIPALVRNLQSGNYVQNANQR